jgi:ABC-type phosphate transport system substrate-binding protein
MASKAYATDCNSLPGHVLVTGSSAVQPFMAALGAALYSSGTTIVYQSAGSCNGVNAMVHNTLVSGTAKYYPSVDDAGKGVPTDCDVTPPDAGTTVTGQQADLGVSDVFPDSCAGGAADPTKIGDFWGPNQVMVFVAPEKANTVKNISAEAAYYVMGQPDNAKTVSPWTDMSKLYIRSASSGTQTMIGAAIHLPSASWHGTNAMSAAGVEANLKAADMTDPNFVSVLGIVSTGEADNDRSFMKVLGFQDFGQKCAYWPDSSLNSFDKKWVRGGQYPIWGPLHMLAAVSATGGDPTNPTVKKIIGYFKGEMPPGNNPNLILDLEIANHTVPQCAMKVKRTSELGAYMPNDDAHPCGCYFDAHIPGGTTSCKTCTTDSDCGDAGNTTCSYGYCEAK